MHATQTRTPLRLTMDILLLIGCAVGVLWVFGALWFIPPIPAVPHSVLPILWLTVTVLVYWRFSLPLLVILVGGALLLALWWFFAQQPLLDREWSRDQARLPQVRFDGERVTIANLRHARYRSVDDYAVEWVERSYDRSALRSVDFVVEPFAAWRGPAHVLLSFGFADGEYLAISAEIRKQRGESFSALAGLFRRYELMYVIGDERDLIGLRANQRGHDVYVYPIQGNLERMRAMLVSMLERAQTLAHEPEFYNSLTNTCSSNIVRHLEEVRGERMRLDYRVIFPGFSDGVAYDLGLLGNDATLDELRMRHRINARSALLGDGADWSRQIREVATLPGE